MTSVPVPVPVSPRQALERAIFDDDDEEDLAGGAGATGAAGAAAVSSSAEPADPSPESTPSPAGATLPEPHSKKGVLRRIFLVRHAMSQGNLDHRIYEVLPDQAIPLSYEGSVKVNGEKQSRVAGRVLRRFYDELVDNGEQEKKVLLVHSSFERARQTAQIIAKELGPHVHEVRENAFLGEQDFGIFEGEGWTKLEHKYPHALRRYRKAASFKNRFWCRVPLGESRFDVCARVYLSFGSFHRDAMLHKVTDLIIVAHGVSIRAFLMMWLHKTPEWFEKSSNPNNCSIRYVNNLLPREYKDRGWLFEGFDRIVQQKRKDNAVSDLLAGSGENDVEEAVRGVKKGSASENNNNNNNNKSESVIVSASAVSDEENDGLGDSHCNSCSGSTGSGSDSGSCDDSTCSLSSDDGDGGLATEFHLHRAHRHRHHHRHRSPRPHRLHPQRIERRHDNDKTKKKKTKRKKKASRSPRSSWSNLGFAVGFAVGFLSCHIMAPFVSKQCSWLYMDKD